MKKNILVVLFAMLFFYGCNDVHNPYEHEIIVNRDCSMEAEFGFDSDSIRCGKYGNIYFGVARLNDNDFSRFDLFLFSDSSAKDTKDSIWLLEMDPDEYSVCENIKLDNLNFPGVFCLKNIEVANREFVSDYTDLENNIYGRYFIYSKHGSYKAFCNIISMNCNLTFSCMVQYEGTYVFSRVPNAKEVKQNFMVGCPF